MISFLVVCAGIVAFGVLVALIAFFGSVISDAVDRWKRKIEMAAIQNERDQVDRLKKYSESFRG